MKGYKVSATVKGNVINGTVYVNWKKEDLNKAIGLYFMPKSHPTQMYDIPVYVRELTERK